MLFILLAIYGRHASVIGICGKEKDRFAILQGDSTRIWGRWWVATGDKLFRLEQLGVIALGMWLHLINVENSKPNGFGGVLILWFGYGCCSEEARLE